MPQPVDLPTELVRATTIQRVQQVAERVALAGQQRAEAEIEAERVAREREVRETHNKNEEVEQELRRRNPYRGRRGRRHEPDDTDAEEAKRARDARATSTAIGSRSTPKRHRSTTSLLAGPSPFSLWRTNRD